LMQKNQMWYARYKATLASTIPNSAANPDMFGSCCYSPGTRVRLPSRVGCRCARQQEEVSNPEHCCKQSLARACESKPRCFDKRAGVTMQTQMNSHCCLHAVCSGLCEVAGVSQPGSTLESAQFIGTCK
jgi:hypothetical protein